jgi:D-serine deaminase-like pyridoxal phosphate-dependent protein
MPLADARDTTLDEDVSTPFAYVDTDRLAANISRMRVAADTAGLALRPHVKTHKLAAIARMQLDAGAVGLTVAKLSEAEALVRAGVVTSYLIAHPFWAHAQIARFVALQATCEVIACVDSLALAERLSAAAGDRDLPVCLIVDTGYGRFGVPPERAVELAVSIAALPRIALSGIRSHAGQVYGEPDPEARRRTALADLAAMSQVAEGIRSAGVELTGVSVGSTPGADAVLRAGELGAVNELRPGNYVFFDRQQVSMGVAGLDECALTIVSTVVSRPRPHRAILDAGKLTLSSTEDPLAQGYGMVVDRPGAVVVSLSQECASVRCDDELELGARVRVLPNHACEITNLAPVVYFGAAGRIDGVWHAEAARCTT